MVNYRAFFEDKKVKEEQPVTDSNSDSPYPTAFAELGIAEPLLRAATSPSKVPAVKLQRRARLQTNKFQGSADRMIPVTGIL